MWEVKGNSTIVLIGSMLALWLSLVAPCLVKTQIRYLEGNSFVVKIGDVDIWIDPVLSGNLDFGMPALYSGKKRLVDNDKELDAFKNTADVVLITQGFDDHAHTPTLQKLRTIRPDIPYVVPTSAVKILRECNIPEKKISVMSPMQKLLISKDIELVATSGALLGPPWKKKENGYILRKTPSSSSPSSSFPSIYIEPHCMYDENELAKYACDVVITPIVRQSLPAFELVGGGEKALKLASVLKGNRVNLNASILMSASLTNIIHFIQMTSLHVSCVLSCIVYS